MNRCLEFKSDTGLLADMRHEVREYLKTTTLDEMQAELIVLALDEACTNIIRYAYDGRRDCPIQISMDSDPEQLRCTIRDYGKSCDPKKIQSRELDDFRPGGLGVRIMKTAFDEVNYQPCDEGTKLVMVKNLPPIPPQNASARKG